MFPMDSLAEAHGKISCSVKFTLVLSSLLAIVDWRLTPRRLSSLRVETECFMNKTLEFPLPLYTKRLPSQWFMTRKRGNSIFGMNTRDASSRRSQPGNHAERLRCETSRRSRKSPYGTPYPVILARVLQPLEGWYTAVELQRLARCDQASNRGFEPNVIPAAHLSSILFERLGDSFHGGRVGPDGPLNLPQHAACSNPRISEEAMPSRRATS